MMASPTSSLSDSAPTTVSLGSLHDQDLGMCTGNSSDNEDSGLSTKCGICQDTFTLPKVLLCLHTFCQPCLEKLVATESVGDKLVCPQCNYETQLPLQGVSILPTDCAITNMLESSAFDLSNSALNCTGCKSSELNAVARCFDCANFLCPNCVMAHQFMHCFEGHRVMTLGELQQNNREDLKLVKPIYCTRHKTEVLKYYCRSCNIPICKDCTVMDHPKGIHDFDHLTDIGHKQVEVITQQMSDSKLKSSDLRNIQKTVEHTTSKLRTQYHKSQSDISETFQFYQSVLEERKQETLKELESVYNAKLMSLSMLTQKVQEAIEKILQTCNFVERLMKHSSNVEVLMFKKLLDSRFVTLLNYNPEPNQTMDIEFVSNYQAIQVGVRNTFGYIRHQNGSSVELSNIPCKIQPPIARPPSVNGSTSPVNGLIDRSYNSHLFSESNILTKRFSSANCLGPFTPTAISDLNPYEKWSSGTGLNSDIFQNGCDQFSTISSDTAYTLNDLSSKLISSTSIFPPKSQIKRHKMIYNCKFGEFGVMEGQFTEPSGVAVNAQNDIIVADTNNHRIQIFDKEGRFKFQFGECGKRDSQLLYPNRVAVVKASGDIVVTERSPTHQIQIYNQYGQFVRKFGASVLQHPRGVTVDNKGRIIVVECKVMRVIIFDQMGNVLQKFGCSKHLEFPNGVVVNDKQEIFISDNRAHCVKVFNYEGIYLRQIGGEGITNYPIGVGINAAGEILIADNHNNFNLTIFSQEGTLVNALESKVKHAQCFDVALMCDGSVVLASKDYRLYIYRYTHLPQVSSL